MDFGHANVNVYSQMAEKKNPEHTNLANRLLSVEDNVIMEVT